MANTAQHTVTAAVVQDDILRRAGWGRDVEGSEVEQEEEDEEDWLEHIDTKISPAGSQKPGIHNQAAKQPRR